MSGFGNNPPGGFGAPSFGGSGNTFGAPSSFGGGGFNQQQQQQQPFSQSSTTFSAVGTPTSNNTGFGGGFGNANTGGFGTPAGPTTGGMAFGSSPNTAMPSNNMNNNMFGQSSNTAFGTSSNIVNSGFGNSTPSNNTGFGGFSTSGNTGVSFGTSDNTMFGGSSNTPFGSSSNTTNNPSTPFGGNSFAPAFGGTPIASNTTTTTNSTFTGTSSNPFGASNPQANNPFGSAPPNSSSSMAFGVSSNVVASTNNYKTGFQNTGGGFNTGFGNNTNNNAFGNNDVNSNAFGTSSNVALGPSTTPAFGASNSTSFSSSQPNSGTNTGFGVTTAGFGNQTTSASNSSYGQFSTSSAQSVGNMPFGNVPFATKAEDDDEMADDGGAASKASNLPFGTPVTTTSSTNSWPAVANANEAPSDSTAVNSNEAPSATAFAASKSVFPQSSNSQMDQLKPSATNGDELATIKAKLALKKKKLEERMKRKEEERKKREGEGSSKLNPDAASFVPDAASSSLAQRNALRFATSNDNTTKSLLPTDLQLQTDDDITASNTLRNAGGRSDRENLENAKSLIGTCMYMCPDEEMLRRERESDIQLLEKPLPDGKFHPKNWTLRDTMVKRFRRSAADYKLDVPEWVRPPDVLERVCSYLEEWIMERDRQGPDPRFQNTVPLSLDVYQFIWDRTRMVRKDFILQNYVGTGGMCDARAIRCHERIARWHCMCEHQLSHIPDFVTKQSQQNIQELGQTMKTLNQYYDDAMGRSLVEVPDDQGAETRTDLTNFNHGCESDTVHGPDPIDYDASPLSNSVQPANVENRIVGQNSVTSPHHGTAEPEMRGLYILLSLNNDGGMEVVKYAAALLQKRPQVYYSTPVQLALSIFKAKNDSNFAKFFSILRDPSTPYLFACLMFKYVADVRREAIRVFSKSFGGKVKDGSIIGDLYTLKRFTHVLCFESEEEAYQACRHYNITVKEDAKGTPHISWRQTSFKEQRDPEKDIVVPLYPKKMVKTIESKLNGATRLAVCRGEVSGEGAFLSAEQTRLVRGVARSAAEGSSLTQQREEALRAMKAKEEMSKRLYAEEKAKEAEARQQRLLAEQERKRQMEELKKQQLEQKKEQERLAREERDREIRRLEEEKKREEVEKAAAKRKLEEENRRRREEEMRQEFLRKKEEEEKIRMEEERKRRVEEQLRREREAEAERRRIEEDRKRQELLRQQEEERRRLEEARRLEEQQRRRREAEALLRQKQLESRVVDAKKRLLWERLLLKTQHLAVAERTKSRLLQFKCKTSARFMLPDENSIDDRAPTYSRDLRGSLDGLIAENHGDSSLGKALVNRLVSSLQASKYLLKGNKATFLFKVAFLFPTCDNNYDQILCNLMRTLLRSYINFDRVQESKNDKVDVRLVLVDADSQAYQSPCDAAVVIIPPSWSDRAGPIIEDVLLDIDESIPSIILALRDDQHQISSNSSLTIESFFKQRKVMYEIVSNKTSSPSSVRDLLHSGIDKVGAILCAQEIRRVERISTGKLFLKCLTNVLWFDENMEQTRDLAEHVRESVNILVNEICQHSAELVSSKLSWPSRDFSQKNENYVPDYFGKGAHLPLDWTTTLEKEFLQSDMMALVDLFQDTIPETLRVLLCDNDIAMKECEALLDARKFRSCIEKAFSLSIESDEREGLCHFIYLPTGWTDKLLVLMTDSMRGQTFAISSNSRIMPFSEGFIEEIDHPPEENTPRILENSGKRIRSVDENILVRSEAVSDEINSISARKKQRHLATNDTPRSQSKRRVRGSVAKSRSFTDKLKRLLHGEEMCDMLIGNGKSSLSAALKGAPPIEKN